MPAGSGRQTRVSEISISAAGVEPRVFRFLSRFNNRRAVSAVPSNFGCVLT